MKEKFEVEVEISTKNKTLFTVAKSEISSEELAEAKNFVFRAAIKATGVMPPGEYFATVTVNGNSSNDVDEIAFTRTEKGLCVLEEGGIA